MLVIIDKNGNIKDLASIGNSEQEKHYANFILERKFDATHSIKEITDTEWDKHCELSRYRLACLNATKDFGFIA